MKYVLKKKEYSKVIRFSRERLFFRQSRHVYKTELRARTFSPTRVLNVEYQSADVILQDRVSFFGYWIS